MILVVIVASYIAGALTMVAIASLREWMEGSHGEEKEEAEEK